MNHYYDMKYFVKKKADISWKLGNSAISFYDLTFILSGEATYISGNQTYHVSAGEAIFLPFGSDRYAQTNGMECVAFNFETDQPFFPHVTKITWDNDALLTTYFEDFHHSWNLKSNISQIRCEGLFLLIISRLLELQQLKRTNPYINQIKSYLHHHYTEPITVQMVADLVNLNPVYCGALFTKETGNTILHYANELRITKAKELLQCTNASISEIAAEVGFEDLYYFSRIFKKLVGFSPKEYRKRI
jgi:YesN/AraC family two-component response regulator